MALGIINVLFLSVALVALRSIVTTATTPAPPVMIASVDGPSAPNVRAPGPPVPSTPEVRWTVVTRNLFSPTRSEPTAEPEPAPPSAGVLPPPPHVVGVAIAAHRSIAYLRHAESAAVAAYRVGDLVAGGVVQAIAADHVELARPDGVVVLRARDPARRSLRDASLATAVPPGEPSPFRGILPPPGSITETLR